MLFVTNLFSVSTLSTRMQWPRTLPTVCSVASNPRFFNCSYSTVVVGTLGNDSIISSQTPVEPAGLLRVPAAAPPLNVPFVLPLAGAFALAFGVALAAVLVVVDVFLVYAIDGLLWW